jgi:hypothetical protein
MIDRQASKNLAVHLILDNYATQSTDVQQAQAAPLAVHRDLLRRGSFSAPAEHVVAIEEYFDAYTEVPKPLVWTATAEWILEKGCSGEVALQQIVDQ